MVDLSLIGETVLDWNEEDMNIYHKKRLEVDSLISDCTYPINDDRRQGVFSHTCRLSYQ